MRRTKIAEGKTKIVWEGLVKHTVLIESKDDLTAGDGEKHHLMEDKGQLANRTTCNVFDFLLHNLSEDVPISFLRKETETTFSAQQARMIPIELVARRLATGSYLKRHPEVNEGAPFKGPPLVEFFLKDDKRHDPLMVYDANFEQVILYDAKKPLPGGYIANHPEDKFGLHSDLVDTLIAMTQRVFEVLEKAWARQDVALVDLKIECGYSTEDGQLMVADVIDNDSWRIWPGEDPRRMKDKQLYRNLDNPTPEDMARVFAAYKWVANATNQF